MAANYATLAELKNFVGIDDTTDDATLQPAIDAASRAVDRYCRRFFYADAAPVARYWNFRRKHSIFEDPLLEEHPRSTVDVRDISSVTGLVLETDDDGNGTYETLWTINTDFVMLPRNAAADERPWTAITTAPNGAKSFPWGDGRIRLTARYGWPAVPPQVKTATLIQAARFFKRKDSPFGVAGSPEVGSELRLLSALDPDVQALVLPMRRLVIQ